MMRGLFLTRYGVPLRLWVHKVEVLASIELLLLTVVLLVVVVLLVLILSAAVLTEVTVVSFIISGCSCWVDVVEICVALLATLRLVLLFQGLLAHLEHGGLVASAGKGPTNVRKKVHLSNEVSQVMISSSTRMVAWFFKRFPFKFWMPEDWIRLELPVEATRGSTWKLRNRNSIQRRRRPAGQSKVF